jgi:hypothetical protein
MIGRAEKASLIEKEIDKKLADIGKLQKEYKSL